VLAGAGDDDARALQGVRGGWHGSIVRGRMKKQKGAGTDPQNR